MQLEVIDKFGRVRPFRRGDHLADGEVLRVPLTFMDAMTRDALAQKYGRHAVTDHQPRGFVRGYAFADTTPPRSAQADAAAAYEEKRQNLQRGSRRHNADAGDDDVLLPTQEARAVADRAWLDKKERLQNSWRMK